MTYRERLEMKAKDLEEPADTEYTKAVLMNLRQAIAQKANAHLANLPDLLELVEAAMRKVRNVAEVTGMHASMRTLDEALAELRAWRDG